MLDPADDNIILVVIDKMKKWFGKTKIDESSDAWKSFRDIMRIKQESMDYFLFGFETKDLKLNQSAVQISNLILALQLLEAVDITSDQRKNIIVNVKAGNFEKFMLIDC